MTWYESLTAYPNSIAKHQLKVYKSGDGTCSCGNWDAMGFSERSLIRTHQYHIANLPETHHDRLRADR